MAWSTLARYFHSDLGFTGRKCKPWLLFYLHLISRYSSVHFDNRNKEQKQNMGEKTKKREEKKN